MASALSSTLPLAVPLAGLFALVPDEAEACSPSPCSYTAFIEDVQPINTGAIPIDGVLVLQATGGRLVDIDLPAELELVVTRDGQPIAGAVELTDNVGILIWRPAAPLEPGVHQLDLHFENADDYGYGCGPSSSDVSAQLLVEDKLSAPLEPPVLTHELKVSIDGSEELGDLVCCDDAFPIDGDYCGDGVPYWYEGDCAPHSGTGFLQVVTKIEPQADPGTSGLLLRSLLVEGALSMSGVVDEASARFDHPFCTQVKLLNLATGETVVSEPVCHGQDLVDQLGPQSLDPVAELAGKCVGPLYTCAINEDAPRGWDPENCTPFVVEQTTEGPTTSDSQGATETANSDSAPTTAGPDSDTAPMSGSEGGGQDDGLVDHGCACDGGAGAPGGLLGLLGLGVLARRRRR